jgi:hypothetical protein
MIVRSWLTYTRPARIARIQYGTRSCFLARYRLFGLLCGWRRKVVRIVDGGDDEHC